MKLIFVYNANSGKINALIDSAHKMVSPETYNCDLCSLTHGAFKEKEEWIRFRESVNTPLVFLHKDEFLKAYKSKWLPKYTFPIVLAQDDHGLEVVITATGFESITTVEELITKVQNILKSPK